MDQRSQCALSAPNKVARSAAAAAPPTRTTRLDRLLPAAAPPPTPSQQQQHRKAAKADVGTDPAVLGWHKTKNGSIRSSFGEGASRAALAGSLSLAPTASRPEQPLLPERRRFFPNRPIRQEQRRMHGCSEESAGTQYQYPTISSRLFAGRASWFKCSRTRRHREGKRGDKCLCRAMRVDGTTIAMAMTRHVSGRGLGGTHRSLICDTRGCPNQCRLVVRRAHQA